MKHNKTVTVKNMKCYSSGDNFQIKYKTQITDPNLKKRPFCSIIIISNLRYENSKLALKKEIKKYQLEYNQLSPLYNN